MSLASPSQVAKIAPIMNTLTIDVLATPEYEVMSDALIWSDELPNIGKENLRDFWCLRPLLRYRTTLILDKPDQECEAYSFLRDYRLGDNPIVPY